MSRFTDSRFNFVLLRLLEFKLVLAEALANIYLVLIIIIFQHVIIFLDLKSSITKYSDINASVEC
jgi:hypothetical protein